MRRYYQVASLIFLGFSAFMLMSGTDLNYYTSTGPGPGFFPRWLSIILGVLSVAWFLNATFKPSPPMKDDFLPGKTGTFKLVAVVLLMALAAWFLDTLGFQIVAFVFLFFLIAVLGRQNLALTLVLCLAGSVGVYYVFNTWLQVELPASSIELLADLGL